MKIAALGDIHGNYQALITAVDHVESWHPDLVLVLGDIVNRGPRSQDCLRLIEQKAAQPTWKVIRGNHEGYVLNFEEPEYAREGHDRALQEVIYWTYRSLSSQEITYLRELPERIDLALPGFGPVTASHASTAGERIGIFPNTPAAKLPELVPTSSRLFLVGHTHQPLVRKFENTTIVNAGSIGLPFDGDTRAGYAQLCFRDGEWQGEIIRLDYDLRSAEADYYGSGFIPEGGPLAELILAELRLGWPQLGKWFTRFEQPFRQGLISLEDAVYEFLKNPNIEYRDPGYLR